MAVMRAEPHPSIAVNASVHASRAVLSSFCICIQVHGFTPMLELTGHLANLSKLYCMSFAAMSATK